MKTASMNISIDNNYIPLPPKPLAQSEIIKNWKSNLDKPLVSFVCLTYNHAKFIRETIHGFLIQETDFPYEIIIHDDASTDGTQDIIFEYAKNYPQIIKPIFQTENQFSKGINFTETLFASVRGRFIALCEGDDYWVDPCKIAKQITFLESNPEYVICYSDSIPFKDGQIINKNYGGALRDLSKDELKRSPNIFTLTSCFRNVISIPPEFILAKYGDLFLWTLLGHHGKGKYLNDVMPSMYRIHSGGVHSASSFDTKTKMFIATYSAILTYYRRIGDRSLEEYFLHRLADLVVVNYGKQRLIAAIKRKLDRLITKLFKGQRLTV